MILAHLLFLAGASQGGGDTTPPSAAPSGLGVLSLAGKGTTGPVTFTAKHRKNGQFSTASGSVIASYVASDPRMRALWTNGDPTAYTVIYQDGVPVSVANPGATSADFLVQL